MPELPDVEAQRLYLESTALYQPVDGAEVLREEVLEDVRAQELEEGLEGRTFESTDRHGKYLFVLLDDGHWLVLHFGMTGFLRYFKDPEKEPEHDRLLVAFDNGYHLAYDCQRLLGEVGLVDDVDGFVAERGLGIDALDPELTPEAFLDLFAGRRAMVKPALMDQETLAGLGNVYTDEVLFRARLHPRTALDDLTEADLVALYETMRTALEEAIEAGPEPERLPDRFLVPWRHEGGRCPRGHGALEKLKVSGRSAYVCPACQGPGPQE